LLGPEAHAIFQDRLDLNGSTNNQAHLATAAAAEYSLLSHGPWDVAQTFPGDPCYLYQGELNGIPDSQSSSTSACQESAAGERLRTDSVHGRQILLESRVQPMLLGSQEDAGDRWDNKVRAQEVIG